MYDLFPEVKVEHQDNIWQGQAQISNEIKQLLNQHQVVTIDCYPTFDEKGMTDWLKSIKGNIKIIPAKEAFLTDDELTANISEILTNDRIFGKMSLHIIQDYIDATKMNKLQREIQNSLKINQQVIVYGVGATVIWPDTTVIYADLSRWEVQQRYQSGKYSNWNCNNAGADPMMMIKRGYFFDWLLADRYKLALMNQHQIDYYMDINDINEYKMVTSIDYLAALSACAKQPFRLVPYFDKGVWGGHWMQEKFGAGSNSENLAWGFDGVPEENSVLLRFDKAFLMEIPANNIVLTNPQELMGEKVFGRFGYSFPIRFDFLDTMGGQNLSLQVHPQTTYAQNVFGLHYTQDESYYIVDCKPDAKVYLGVQDGITHDELFTELEKAQKNGAPFPDKKYINMIKVKPHDHFSIPAGTIHCGGANSVILEISATPNRFTFKLWDWGRIGLDGLPRPIHLEHGAKNVAVSRDTTWVNKYLINQIMPIAAGDGWTKELTGLHASEFIETTRISMTKPVTERTNGTVNMLNLVKGSQVIINSPNKVFEPYLIHFGETFIIPASIDEYTIIPESECILMKAAVR